MLLAMDTATQTASLALLDLHADHLQAEWTWQARRRQTQDLLAAAKQMLAQVNATPDQISALAVTTGPGSFTGVRIAISAAKGIGMGLPQTPQVVGVPTLAVTAAPWLALLDQDTNATVCAYLQAGRGRCNWVLFSKNDPLWKPTVDDHTAGTHEEFIAALADAKYNSIFLVGESTPELHTAATALPHVYPLDAISTMRRAGLLARLASQHIKQTNTDTLASLQPLYLQAP